MKQPKGFSEMSLRKGLCVWERHRRLCRAGVSGPLSGAGTGRVMEQCGGTLPPCGVGRLLSLVAPRPQSRLPGRAIPPGPQAPGSRSAQTLFRWEGIVSRVNCTVVVVNLPGLHGDELLKCQALPGKGRLQPGDTGLP